MKGFINLGSTCYFNVALQCLLHIPVLTNYLIRHPYHGSCAFTTLYCSIVTTYWTKGPETIELGELITLFQTSFPRFKTDEQHDVQETILCIIDIIERADPTIKHWFYGKKVQETVWPGGKSSNEEAFSVHLIPSIPGDTDMAKMFEKSTGWDTLDAFEDDTGQVHAVAVTRQLFSRLPQIFMVSFDAKSQVRIIEHIHIDDHEYSLIACAVHVGHQNDGHYVSFVKNKNKWFIINDTSIKQMDLPEEASYYFMVYNLKTPA